MGRNVLVFGATGEIGGRIAKGCVEAGHQVFGVSRGANTRAQVGLDGVEMIQGDKNDEAFLREVSAKLTVDVVIDSVPSKASVDLYHKHFRDVENVLFCSSTGTFVPLLAMPADESHPWREQTPVNFWSQCERDAYALEMWEREQFPVTILRPTNIIGWGRVPLELWGARDIEFFRMLKRSEPVTIAPCEQILVQSGHNTDLASAFVKAVDCPDTVRGELFIISCKRAISLGRYLQTAMDFLGSSSEILHTPAEKLQEIYPQVTMKNRMDFLLEHMCFDIGKAERILGYCPARTTEQGLVEALEWCCETKLL